MIEFISQPWTWYVSGILIALVMFLLMREEKSFGMSSNLSTLCTIAGAGKFADLFRWDWKTQKWNLMLLLGTVIGGFIAANFLTPDESIALSSSTVSALEEMGLSNVGETYAPYEIFGDEALFSWKGIGILALGGFLVGFGTRYAGGCTSGHAITGLSHLQFPSLIAVIGFFIGGLISTNFILPILLK